MNKSDLKEDLLNANKGTTRGKKMLERSLEKLGAGRSILTDRAGNIIAGNKTFAAARDREVIVVPSDGSKLVVVQRTDLEIDSPKARELAIADNRIAEVDLEWDAAALEKLTEIDLREFWTDAELRRLFDSDSDIDAPEPRIDQAEALAKKWKTAPEQLWNVGPHKIFCGDSTQHASWDGRIYQLCFTDPPWNVAIGGDSNPRHRQRQLLENDSQPAASFQKFLNAFLENLGQFLAGDLYCVLATREWPTLDAAIRSAGFHWSTVIVWVKDSFVLGRSQYHHRFEPIWYGWPEKGKSSFCGGRDIDDVWEIPRPKQSEEHPTMKPVELAVRAIRNSSERGGLVVDPFLGAGSTMAAAHRLQRICYGIEIDPKYVAVSLERMSEMGIRPELSGKETYTEQQRKQQARASATGRASIQAGAKRKSRRPSKAIDDAPRETAARKSSERSAETNL
jgi:DNA modification methylase